MGVSPACCTPNEEYNKQWKMMMSAYTDSTIVLRMQQPQMMLSRRNRPLNYWERFWRVVSEPLYYLQIKDVWRDIDEMVVSKGMSSDANTTDTISKEDFLEWFSDISPWNQFLNNKGWPNIKRLLDIVDDFEEICAWETPLVKDG